MLFGSNSYRGFFESATADLLDPDVSGEVKDVVEDLEDALTNNVPEVAPEEKETNGATELLAPTKESCILYEGANGQLMLNVFDLMRICEAEEAETGAAPNAADVAADVADANGASEDDLVIVAPLDTAKELVEACIMEAKCGKSGKKAKNKKKANGLAKAIKSLKKRGFKVKTIRK